jgi:triosephosphate isomerase
MSASNCFQSLDVTRLHDSLDRVHEAVGSGTGRVEVTRAGCDDVCVLISKRELDAMEHALEILCGGSEFQSMCDEIKQLAAATSVLTGEASAQPQA